MRFAAKVQKGDWPIAVVWNGMTISELAAVLNTSPGKACTLFEHL